MFSFYLNHFGHESRTYGAFAGVAALLLWLYLTGLVVMFGAELDCEIERSHANLLRARTPSVVAALSTDNPHPPRGPARGALMFLSVRIAYSASDFPGSRLRFSAPVTQIIALIAPLSPVSFAERPVLPPLLGIFPFSTTSMMSPEAQWNLGFVTWAFFLVLVGEISLVLNVNVVVDPSDQLIDDVPLVAPVKKNVPDPGALGEGEQPLTVTVPIAFPFKVVHEPLTGLGFDVADATPGADTATTSMGTVSVGDECE